MFLDETVYQAWRQTSDNHLAAGEILAITEPISLGGAFQLNNFQVEPIEEYFATTGPIYRKALS